MSRRSVAIVGVGQTPCSSRRDDVTYYELAREPVVKALNDANLTIGDIEAFVYSMAPDSLIGISSPDRWIIDAIGATNKPFMRINTGGSSGLSALQVGYYHIASGIFDTVLVMGVDRVGESGDAQTILNKIWDPFYERSLPLNTITMLAFQAVRFMHKYGTTEEHMAMISVKNHKNALLNPYAHIRKEVTIEDVLKSPVVAWPIKLYDSCPQSTGGAAIILCSEEKARKITDTPAWIKGLGHCSETYYMGDRMGAQSEGEHADSPALRIAAKRAYAMAGITDPVKEIDVAELYGPFSNVELHAIQDVGLCKPGEIGKLVERGFFNLDGELPVNPSGGVLCSNPIAATALIRAAEVALQVCGKADDHQVPEARTGIATGIGGDHQFFATMVISCDK